MVQLLAMASELHPCRYEVDYLVDTPTDFESNRAKSNVAEGRLPRLVAVLSLTSLPDL